jgi:predicted DNA-binding transcriptional regulator AlpA
MQLSSNAAQDGTTPFLFDSGQVRKTFGNRSDMWLWRRIKDGTLPKPLVIAGRRYWRKTDIDGVIDRLASNNEAA